MLGFSSASRAKVVLRVQHWPVTLVVQGPVVQNL